MSHSTNPPNARIDIDTSAKRSAECVTAESPGNNQLLYFTSPSLTADGQHLVFLSDRTGVPNLFVRDMASGRERPLTTNQTGVLKSYVYFDGIPYQGLGKASASLDVHRGVVYFIEGRRICAVTLDGAQRVLAEYPADQMTAYTHVSADGRWLCIPTTDARVLDGDRVMSGPPDYNVDDRVRAENLSSYVRIYDTATGAQVACERIPGGWVTHVQFSPTRRDWITYNHEWTVADRGLRRLWLWDGKHHRRLRVEGDGSTRADHVTHEMWERDGSAIVYHGCFATPQPGRTNLRQFVGRIGPDDSSQTELPLPEAWGRYGHYTVGNGSDLVSDGYYEEPDDPVPQPKGRTWMNGGAWISVLRPDWKNRSIRWMPLCRHGSTWVNQDSHPHPVFSEDGKSILFTSDQSGRRAIYRVAVP
ncbi:MAG TPA: hypothetical protein VHE61_13050 [Opitutaceae bacterium]|nr:hypothetical protein [Opitutaceae bacterium]